MTQPVDTLPASPGDEKWLGGRKWTGLAAVIILGVLLVAAGGVLFSDNGSGQQPQPATAPTATVHAKPDSAQDQSLPTSAPTNVTWTLYQGVALPLSQTAGPNRVSGAIASGFAHSPTGALVASLQLSSRVFLAPDSKWQQAVDAMTIPGAQRETWIAKRQTLHFGNGEAAPPGTYAQYAGFQFVGYSPDLAVVEIANGAQNRGYTGSTITLVWRGGDWKLQLGKDGGTATNTHAIADLTGFTPWGGVS